MTYFTMDLVEKLKKLFQVWGIPYWMLSKTITAGTKLSFTKNKTHQWLQINKLSAALGDNLRTSKNDVLQCKHGIIAFTEIIWVDMAYVHTSKQKTATTEDTEKSYLTCLKNPVLKFRLKRAAVVASANDIVLLIYSSAPFYPPFKL